MKPKLWQFALAGGSTTIYWPTDTYISTQEYSFNVRQVAGTGNLTTATSAAFTVFPVLSRGVASANFVQVTAAAGFHAVHEDPASCFRFVVAASGAATVEIVALQSGPERAQ